MSTLRDRIEGLSPWQFSGLLHGMLLLLAAGFLSSRPNRDLIDLTVIDVPTLNPAAQKMPDHVAKPIAAPKKPTAPAVFGVSRKAFTSDGMDGEAVKLGNTVVTAPDDRKLKDTDPDALPIPSDEFMVSAMPVLVSEVRVPYPPEARKYNVQGTVVMDLLVDAAGRVRQVTLLEGPGYGMNEAAMEAAKGFAFTPARIGEQPVAVRIRYAYRFVIER